MSQEEELEIAHKKFVNEGKRKTYDPSEERPSPLRLASATSRQSVASVPEAGSWIGFVDRVEGGGWRVES